MHLIGSHYTPSHVGYYIVCVQSTLFFFIVTGSQLTLYMYLHYLQCNIYIQVYVYEDKRITLDVLSHLQICMRAGGSYSL